MPKTRGPYPPEFRRRIVELVRAGRTPETLAKEFEPSAVSIRKWVEQADADAGKSDGLTTDECAELQRLRRENRVLREEKEILRNRPAPAAASGGLKLGGVVCRGREQWPSAYW